MKKLNSLLLIISLAISLMFANIQSHAATIISNANGNWNNLSTWYVTLTGTINATTTSTNVTGNGTTFTTQLQVGTPIINILGTVIGTVQSIQSNTQLTLNSNATANMTSANTVRFQKIPTTADDVRIINHTITVNATAVCNTLQISGTGTTAANLNFNAGISLTVTGATTMTTPPGNALYTVNVNGGSFTTGSMVLGGSTASRMNIVNVGSTGSFDCLGNITFSGSGTTTGTRFTFSDFFGGTMTFRGSIVNFQLTQSGLSTVRYLGAGAQTVRTATYGTLVLSGGTKTFQASTSVSSVIEFIGLVTLSGTYTPGSSVIYRFTNVNGTITDAMWPVSTITSGGVEINTSGTTTLNNAKSLAASGINVISGNLNTNNFAVSIAGNLTIGIGASVIGGSSNFTFTGGFNQTIGGFTTTGSIIINKSAGRATFSGTLNAGPLNITTSGTGEASFGTNTNLTFTSLTINTGSAVFGGSNNSITFTANGTNAGTFTPETSSITFIGTSMTIPPMGYYNLTFMGSGTFSYSAGGSANYNNFTMQSVSATLTHTISNSTVINNLSLGANTVFNTGTKTLTVNGATQIDGTLNLNDATASKTLTHVYINSGGTLNNTANAPVSIAGDFANFGTANLGTGNYTFSGNGFQLSGNISIANIIISNNYFNAGTLTVTNSLSGTGTLNNNAAGIININTSSAPSTSNLNFTAVGNTVNYSLAGNQTLRNTTYHHLNLTNSGTKNLPAGTININGNLTISGTVSTQLVATTTIGGNLTLQNTSTFNTSTQNLTVNGNISNVAGSTLTWGSGIITLAGTTQSVSNGNGGTTTINSLVLSGGEKTFDNNLINGTSFSINSGAKFVFGSSTSLTLNGTISGTGTIKAKACGGANNTLTIGGTSNGNTLQLENGFHHLSSLIITKTTGTLIFNDDVAVSTTFTLPTTGSAQITINQDLNWYGTVTITSGAAKINMGPTSSLSIGGCTITGNAFIIPSDIFNGNPTIAGLFLNRTNGLTLGNQMVSVSDLMQLSAGNLNTNNNLTLLSTATKTARVAPVGAGITITGNVIAQRFIPGGNGKRKWRFLSSPVNVSGSIALTQFQDDIFITAPAAAAGGFDVNPFSSNASIRTYDETVAGSASNGWTDPTNVTNTIATGQGIEVFVRGSRALANPYLNWTVPDDVTIDYVGALNTGTVVRNLSFTNTGAGTNDGFNFVGNPYASPINFDSAGLTKVNIENKFWTYNPITTLYGSYNASSGESINGMSKYISSGQAFFVRATAANPSITFTENCKSINAGSNYFRGTNANGKFPTFKITLTNSYSENDECLFIHDNTGTEEGTDETDTYKFFNDELNVYFIADDNSRLAMNAKPFRPGTDTMKLAVWSFDSSSVSVAIHRLSFTRLEEIKPSINIYLRDKYLNNLIDVRQQSVYTFDINTDAASYGNNRFEILLSDVLLTAVEKTSLADVKIFPNPSKDIIYVELGSIKESNDRIEISVFDLFGKQILQKEFTSDEKISLTISELSAGTYILRLKNGNELLTRKIIKN
jgi:hypothetical protein